MHARVTRYEGAAPEAMEQTLETKKRVLPTEFGQTEGMKGAVFLVDRQNGTVLVISLWEGEDAAGERERGDPGSRGSHRTRRDGVGGALRGGAPERRAGGLGST